MTDNTSLSDFISNLPYTYNVDCRAQLIKDNYNEYEGKAVRIAGRVLALRKSGKLAFADIQDKSGKIQCYFDHNKIGDLLFDVAKSLNAGDIIGVKGVVFKTNPGEISINVDELSLLSKVIRHIALSLRGSRHINRMLIITI